MECVEEAMRASALRTGEFFDCYEGSSALLVLPSSFIAGKMMLVRAMTLGWDLTALEPTSEPMRFVSQSYDFAAFTPMQLASASHDDLKSLSRFGAVIWEEQQYPTSCVGNWLLGVAVFTRPTVWPKP